jgi:hypothetical protein
MKVASSYRYDYECRVLKGFAVIDDQRVTNEGPVVTPETADPHIQFNATIHRMICHTRDECGIGRGEIDGIPVYAWELCPAHQTLSETGSLPTTKTTTDELAT